MAHIVSSRYLFVAALILAVACVASANASDTSAVARAHKPVVRASWYGSDFEGKPTADGGRFDPRSFTAAHRTLEFGSKVRVTELRSGHTVIVEITDRGPYYPGRDIDLSYAAARALGMVRSGIARVRVDLVEEEHPIPAAVLSPSLLFTSAEFVTPIPRRPEGLLIPGQTKPVGFPPQICGVI